MLAKESPQTVSTATTTGIRADRVATLIVALVVLLLVTVVGRVVQLQASPSVQLTQHIDDRVTRIAEPGVRGELQDRRQKILATTRFGFRVFVDPWLFPTSPDEPMAKLADAIGMPVPELAQRIIPRMVENERRKLAAPGSPDHGKPMIRYVSLGGILDESLVESVRRLGIPGVHLERRPVREHPQGDLIDTLVGVVGIDDVGLTGAEHMLDARLRPVSGFVEYTRDAHNRPMWVSPGGYQPPSRGEDVRLSIDLELQRIAAEELQRGVDESDAAGGRALVMDPITGEILAMVDIVRDVPNLVDYDWKTPIGQEAGGRPRYRTIRQSKLADGSPGPARNRIVEDAYEPGSTFKPFMWAAVTELGLAQLSEIIDTEDGNWYTPYGRHVADVTARGRMTWAEVLINSSNIGMAKVTRRMSDDQMRDAVVRYCFGQRTGLGLPGESTGLITPRKRWGIYTQTSVAMGHEIAVTPIQMARAFSALCRTGDLAGLMPDVRLTPLASGEENRGVRVVSAKAAEATRLTMKGVAENLDQRMGRKSLDFHPRYAVFGKSGTAEIPLGEPPKGKRRPKGSDGYFQGQYNSSFLAAGPIDKPRLVVIVVIDDPGPEMVRTRRHYGAATAGPVNRRILERGLAYVGVPPSHPEASSAVVDASR